MTCEVTVPSDRLQPYREFVALDCDSAWLREIITKPIFAPIVKGSAATVEDLIDMKGRAA